MLFHSRVLFSLLRLVPFGSVLRFNSFSLSVIARQTCVCFMSGLCTHFTYIHFSGGMKLSACDVLLNSLFNSLSPAFDFWQHESESAKLPTQRERESREKPSATKTQTKRKMNMQFGTNGWKMCVKYYAGRCLSLNSQ